MAMAGARAAVAQGRLAGHDHRPPLLGLDVLDVQLWILGAKLNQMMSQKKPGMSASTSSPLPLEDNSAEDEKDADSKTLGTLRMHIKSKHQIYCIEPDLSTSSPSTSSVSNTSLEDIPAEDK